MKFVVAFLFAAFCAARLGLQAPPSPPSWPLGFSSSIFVQNWGGGNQNTFFRWFYDETQDMSRIDGMAEFLNEWYWSTQIFDHVDQIQWSVFYQLDFETCIKSPMNWSLPVPNFQGAQYLGQAQIGYQPVYHWLLTQGPFALQYFDSQADRSPVRIDFDDSAKHIASTLLFTEFDAGTQDSSLFQLPSAITSTCNSLTTSS